MSTLTAPSKHVGLYSPINQLRVLTVFFTILNVTVTAGIIYGFSGIYRQLKAEKIFYSATSSSDEDSSLTFIATFGFNLANLATVVHGITLDRYGPRINAIFGCLLFSVSCIGLSVSNTLWPLTLSFSGLGWGGIAVYLASFQFSNLFDNKAMLVRSLFNALFTASALTLSIIQYLSTRGFSRADTFGVYALIATIFAAGCFAMFPDSPYHRSDVCSLPIVEIITGEKAIKHEMQADVEDETQEANKSASIKTLSKKDRASAIERKSLLDSAFAAESDVEDEAQKEESAYGEAHDGIHDEKSTVAHHHVDELTDDREALKASWTLKQAILQRQTIFVALFFSFGLLLSNWFTATITIQLENMGDSDGTWAYIFILMSSILPIPIALGVDRAIRYGGYGFGVTVGSTLLISSYLPLYIDSLPLQLVAFCFYSTSRAFVITIMFAYCATEYKTAQYGRIIAFVTIIAFPIGFLQLLMQSYAETWSYRTINSICIGCTIPAFAYGRWLTSNKI